MEDVVGRVHRDRGEDGVAAAGGKTPDRGDDVEHADRERAGASRVAHGEQRDRAGDEVDHVRPSVYREGPEHLDAGVVPE